MYFYIYIYMTRLTKADYITILTHYGKRMPKGKTRATLKRIKGATNRLIASKLCHCVKKVSRSGKKYKSEKITIPICIASILKRRGLKLTGRFACKKKFILTSRKKNKMVKTRKISYLHARRRGRRRRRHRSTKRRRAK